MQSGEGPRNIKSMRLRPAAVFLWFIFAGPGGVIAPLALPKIRY